MSIDSIVNNARYNSALLGSNTTEESDKIAEELRKEKGKETVKEKDVSPGRKVLKAFNKAEAAINYCRNKGLPINSSSIEEESLKMEATFQLKVKASLKLLGVDENIEFKLALDASGKIVVNTDHPDKDKVQNFFDNTPGLADEFKNIQDLKNLKNVMQESKGMTGSQIRSSIQADHLHTFLNGMDKNESYSPLILSYGKSKLTSLAGINLSV